MAKPIKGTNQSDTLNGTSSSDIIRAKKGDDVLNGFDGNDFLFGDDDNDTLNGGDGYDFLDGGKGDDLLNGGRGNDALYGGKGTDTALYQGAFDDYSIWTKSFFGVKTGIIKDNVANRDGIDGFATVEFLQFADATYNVGSGDVWEYSVNAAPDPSAQDPASPGNLFVGSGIPATDFGLARNEDRGIELGLQVIYRQGPTVTTTDNYADGVLHFSVNDGPQSTANGSASDNAARAAWNFEFSVATGLNGETTDLDDFTFQLLYDVDPSSGTSYRTLTLEAEGTPQAPGQSGYQWRDQGTGLVFIADDEGTPNVTQNSENYSFAFFQSFLTSPYGPGNGFTGPAEFDIILQAMDGSNLIAQNHISVDVIL